MLVPLFPLNHSTTPISINPNREIDLSLQLYHIISGGRASDGYVRTAALAAPAMNASPAPGLENQMCLT